MNWEAGMSVTADRLNDGPGYVGEGIRTTASGTITTTETGVQSLTFTAEAGARYRINAVQGAQGTAGESAIARMRIGVGTSVGTSGTIVDSKIVPFPYNALGVPYLLRGTYVAAVDGDHTVGIFLIRNVGTNGISTFGNTSQRNTIDVERAG